LKIYVTFNQGFNVANLREAFKAKLVSSDGTDVTINLKRDGRGGSGDEFWYEFVIEDKVTDGLLTLYNVNKDVTPIDFRVTKCIKGITGVENYFLDNITQGGLSYNPDANA
jgi:hypothetical protein